MKWNKYVKTAVALGRPYVLGEDLTGISVSPTDDPLTDTGGVIFKNPENEADQWYVAGKFFRDNYAPAPPEPKDYRDRVRLEADELEARFNALQDFIGGTVFNGLSDQDRRLLTDQRGAMGEYLGLLQERIDNFPEA